jgi:hypothetical protein
MSAPALSNPQLPYCGLAASLAPSAELAGFVGSAFVVKIVKDPVNKKTYEADGDFMVSRLTQAKMGRQTDSPLS